MRYIGPPGMNISMVLRPSGGHSGVLSWFDNEELYLLHRARTGIKLLCELMGLNGDNEVLVPSYNCGSEIDPLIKGGARVVLYRVARDGSIDAEDVQRRITSKTRAIYVIHYFGFGQDLSPLLTLCREHGLFLIEDCALALFSRDGSEKLGIKGDFSVFSLPKTLPVPDGGILLINNENIEMPGMKLESPPLMNVTNRLIPLLKSTVARSIGGMNSAYRSVQRFTNGAEVSGKTVRENCKPDIPASYYFDKSMDRKSLSWLTNRMLRSFDQKNIRQRRRANYTALLERLTGQPGLKMLYEELPEGVCPLYLPILVNDRTTLIKRLWARGVGAINWWAGYHREVDWREHEDACFLKDHVLALNVNQDLDLADVEYMADSVLASITKGST